MTWTPTVFFFSSRRRHTSCGRDWSSDVCSSDLVMVLLIIIGLIVVQITIKGACIRSVQVGCFLRRPAVVDDKLFHPSLIVFQLYLRYTIPGLHGFFLARKSYQTYRGPLSKPAAR